MIDAYNEFRDIVQIGIEKGMEEARKALKVVLILVIKFCSENKEVLKHLSKMATKTTRGIVVNGLVKVAVRQGADTLVPNY